MRKFKLVKEYPRGPKMPLEIGFDKYGIEIKSQGMVFSLKDCENFDNWEEITEDFPLSYEDLIKGKQYSTYCKLNEGLYTFIFMGRYWRDINGIINDGNNEYNIINNGFHPKNGFYKFKPATKDEMIPQSKVLPHFTTKDMIDIWYGDAFYILDKDSLKFKSWGGDEENIRYICSKNTPYDNKNKIYFSDIEKAKRYILFNEKRLSLNDLIEVWGNTKQTVLTSKLFNNFKLKATENE